MNSLLDREPGQEIKNDEKHYPKLRLIFTVLPLSVLFSIILLFFAPSLRIPILHMVRPKLQYENHTIDKKKAARETKLLSKKLNQLQKRYKRFVPSNFYLIINTNADYFYMMEGREIAREGMCSTGSYIMLTSHDQRTWIFQTPRGLFRVVGKTERPIWYKPDWAFIEDGLPIPPPLSDERFERGVLGDYGLALGHGYLIHGTLYKRFLGLPVTHGCIRMDDEDLEYAYNNLGLGSKVFIY